MGVLTCPLHIFHNDCGIFAFSLTDGKDRKIKSGLCGIFQMHFGPGPLFFLPAEAKKAAALLYCIVLMVF